MPAIRKFTDQVDSVLGKIVEQVTKYTGLIKAIQGDPAVSELIKIIPGGSKAETWFNTALGEITGAVDDTKSLAEKLNEWLSVVGSEYEKNMKLSKLASVAAKVADQEAGSPVKSESTYDSAVQLQVIAEKP